MLGDFAAGEGDFAGGGDDALGDSPAMLNKTCGLDQMIEELLGELELVPKQRSEESVGKRKVVELESLPIPRSNMLHLK